MQEFMAMLRDRIQRETARDLELRAALRRIESGTADFKDTALWSERASTILGEVYGTAIPDIPLETRRAFTESFLREQYETANEILEHVQRALDASQGLSLRSQKAPFPAERVAQLGSSLTDTTVPEETVQRRARAGTANVAKSFHDAYMKENAKFRAKAGLKCYITRDGGAKCCPWCAEMVGRYAYGDEPHDVYRRHDNCSCTVTFENGRQRQDVWSKQTWDAPDKDAGAEPPTRFTDETRPQGAAPPIRFTPEQAKSLQERLTKGRNSAIINEARPLEMLDMNGAPASNYTPEMIIGELESSSIGREILQTIETLPEPIRFTFGEYDTGIRGDERQGHIRIYLNNCKDIVWVARSVIHECTHFRYGIGQSQWAECVCIAQELKHVRKRNELTHDERMMIINAVQDAYPELKWRKGGYINGRQKRK